jgi:hypothetical protein
MSDSINERSGKVVRDEKAGTSSVSEYSHAAGALVSYTRHDNGNIAVALHDDKGNLKSSAVLTPDGDTIITSADIPPGSTVSQEHRREYQTMVRGLVDGAFPKGASEIVPILERKSGNPHDLIKLTGLGANDVDSVIRGNGYEIAMLSGNVTLTQLDGNGAEIRSVVAIKGRGIAMDDRRVPDSLEPRVLDSRNIIPGAKSEAIIALGKKILKDGVISEGEAEELKVAMAKCNVAVQDERTRESRGM